MRRIKPKKCGYSECGKMFIPQRPLQVACSVQCSIKFNEEKEIKKRTKLLKEGATTLMQLEKLARIWFQKWVRKMDEKDPCISCNRTFTKQWDGGHFCPAEIYSGVIFDEMNVNKQCSECNGINMHGNPIGYRQGLIRKYGEDAVRELELRANQTRNYKYTREELIEIANKYKLKLKE